MTDPNQENIDPAATHWPDMKAHLIFWPLVITGFSLDLWSKNAVFKFLWPHDTCTLIGGFLRLVIAENSGAAFGIAAGKRYGLIAVATVVLLAVVVFFLTNSARQRSLQCALALLVAGICGNLYDRIFNNGLVRDFIDVVYWPGKHWPAFNLADSMLCIGVALTFISLLRSSKRHP